MTEFVFSYGPLLFVAVLYLLPVIIGLQLMKRSGITSVKEKLLWCCILAFTSYLGLIGMMIYSKRHSV